MLLTEAFAHRKNAVMAKIKLCSELTSYCPSMKGQAIDGLEFSLTFASPFASSRPNLNKFHYETHCVHGPSSRVAFVKNKNNKDYSYTTYKLCGKEYAKAKYDELINNKLKYLIKVKRDIDKERDSAKYFLYIPRPNNVMQNTSIIFAADINILPSKIYNKYYTYKNTTTLLKYDEIILIYNSMLESLKDNFKCNNI